MKSPFDFKPYGQKETLSDIVAPLGPMADEMAFIQYGGKSGVHSQNYLQATGFQRPGFPGAGSWRVMPWAPRMKTFPPS